MTDKIEVGDDVRVKPYKTEAGWAQSVWVDGYDVGLEGQVVELFKDYAWQSEPTKAVVRIITAKNVTRSEAWNHTVDLKNLELVKKGGGTFELGRTFPFSEKELFEQRLAEFEAKVAKIDRSHEGFCNAATYLAHLYITNDKGALESCRRQRRKDGTINPDKVVKIFHQYKLTIDDWAKEPVFDVPEEFKLYIRRCGWNNNVDWKEVADNID